MLTHLRVTHESKHRRNIANFGPTTLRSTICYNLLRLAHPKPGDVIVDPMCGGGSIPIEVSPTIFLIISDLFIIPRSVQKNLEMARNCMIYRDFFDALVFCFR